MKRYLLISVGFILFGLFAGCAQEKDTSSNSDSSDISVKMVVPADRSDDGNPIPPMWRQMFRWVANAEIDSMNSLFTPGMYFAIKDDAIHDPDEAYKRLRKFYSENKPLSFAYKHDGSSQSGLAKYAIGELATENTNYRVTMVLQEGRIVSLDFELL